jgi:hypothetical protein
MPTPISGQKTVASAGTAVPLGDQKINAALQVKALDTNTGIVAIGNDGANDVTLSNGLRLSAGEVVVFQYVDSLNNLWLDAGVSSEGVSWIILSI